MAFDRLPESPPVCGLSAFMSQRLHRFSLSVTLPGMLTFAVSPGKNRWLQVRMQELGVVEADFEETFVRSSGAGGQHLNKTATCVQLRHRPSGLEVSCMRERSQSINRFIARRELLEKLAQEQGLPTARENEAERIRRQKKRRQRRTARKAGPDAQTEKPNDS